MADRELSVDCLTADHVLQHYRDWWSELVPLLIVRSFPSHLSTGFKSFPIEKCCPGVLSTNCSNDSLLIALDGRLFISALPASLRRKSCVSFSWSVCPFWHLEKKWQQRNRVNSEGFFPFFALCVCGGWWCTRPQTDASFGISSSLTLFSFWGRPREREREKSYDPVYVACLIKKRKEEGQDTLESGRGAHHI